MRRFITSDIHFFHSGILKFCPESRPYKDVTEMNEDIVRKWNTKVNPEDETWILGDVSFGRADDTVKIMNRLNGTKHLVVGNHDRKMLNSDGRFYDCFESVQDYKIISHDGTKCVLFHFPIAEHEGCHKGYIHFFGHVHAKKTGLEEYRCMDIGMDTNNCTVYDLDTVVRLMLKNKIRQHH